MPRVSATIEDGVFERMEKYRGEINFSKVFKDAVPDIVADAIREVEERRKTMKQEAKTLTAHVAELPQQLQDRLVAIIKGNGPIPDQEFDFRPLEEGGP